MQKLLLLVFLSITLIIAGCASAFSGQASVSLSENNNPVKALERLNNISIPRISAQLGSKPVLVYKVAFDGTGNDKSNVRQVRLETAIGFIANLTNGTNYYKGPGTQDNYFSGTIDAAFGVTSKSISSHATDDFFSWVTANQTQALASDIRVAVFGFSRGAAIARDFMNSVSREWVIRFGDKQTPRFFALLYDTVPGRQEKNLKLSLPSSVDYLLHFVALDERRTEFQVFVDEPVDESLLRDEFQIVPRRINLALFPGAHADLGGGYGSGVETYYKLAAAKVLVDFGLSDKNCWSLSGDALAQGMHDSRGWFDKLVGSRSPADEPNVARTAKLVAPDLVSEQERKSADERLLALSNAKSSSHTIFASNRTELESNVFEVTRVGDSLEATHHFTNLFGGGKVTYEFTQGVRKLHVSYIALGASHEEILVIPESVWVALADGNPAVLEYRVGRVDGKTFFDLLLNKKRVQIYMANNPGEAMERVDLLPCK